jgi:hypothetical protein
MITKEAAMDVEPVAEVRTQPSFSLLKEFLLW